MQVERPNPSRVCNFLLGGQHHFAPDREFGRRILEAEPNAKFIVAENRAFVGRAVRFLLSAGVRQFIDVGCGIPSTENVHQVAGRASPAARVVYVDQDPVAVASVRHALAGEPLVTAVEASLVDPESVLGHPVVQRLIDMSEPVGLLVTNVLPFVPDGDDPEGAIAGFAARLALGSYLVITHPTGDAAKSAASVEALYIASRVPAKLRTAPEILRFFCGFDLVDPGLVLMQQWRPDGAPPEHPERAWLYAGIGRKGGEPNSAEI
jgi:S-adenosyl methyltransferase